MSLATLPWSGEAFDGAKIALLHDGQILTYRRDLLPGLPFPGHWDLPGGGRDGAESPADCVLRETAEEFGLRLPPERLRWHRIYPGGRGLPVHFFAGHLTAAEIAAIRFGDEGLEWRLMPAAEFLAHPFAIPAFCPRVAEALAGLSAWN